MSCSAIAVPPIGDKDNSESLAVLISMLGRYGKIDTFVP